MSVCMFVCTPLIFFFLKLKLKIGGDRLPSAPVAASLNYTEMIRTDRANQRVSVFSQQK